MGHFLKGCKYDGDRPVDEGQASFDSYDSVIGKWMTNLVAATSHYSKGYEKPIHRVKLTERPHTVL